MKGTCTVANCPLCKESAEDQIIHVDEQGVVHTAACARTPDFHPDDRASDGQPNRFCPFEALDTILANLDLLPPPPVVATKPYRASLEIEKRVERLRAYITGMER